MTFLLDSADIDDVKRASDLGYVTGLTTNPTLMRASTDRPLDHLARILQATNLPAVYYQPTGIYGSQYEESLAARDLDAKRVVIKLSPTSAGVTIARRLSAANIPTALTAAQSPSAMLLAETIGCCCVIPYVDRGNRDARVGDNLVRRLATVRRGKTLILAASVKSVAQVAQAFLEGADAVTTSLSVLAELTAFPPSVEADETFWQAWRPSSRLSLPMPTEPPQ